jgi:EAL domain-containing protein (putative c-di-GMP-specific phosphodiesterase class I)/GGDEF domain-containing protein
MRFAISSLMGKTAPPWKLPKTAPPRKLPKSVVPDPTGTLSETADALELPARQLDEEIRQLMLKYGQRFDIPTRLMNEQTFQATLAAVLRDCPAGREIALIWIDVLNLRREFALSGSQGVEALVVHIADSLRSAVDSDALLGRFGTRGFLVAMPASKSDRGDKLRIQMTVDAVEPMRVLGAEIRPDIAAGVAFYPADTDSAEELVRYASLAASCACGTRNSTVMSFDASMNSLLLRDHQLEVEIRKGLEENQFRVYYQPKVDLKTGQVLGAEALMRWNHPQWGPVPQSEVIPVAERSNLIHRIFEFGLRTALWDARRWRDRGAALPFISVNVSPANLRRDDFAHLLSEILAENPVAPTKLELEVTESMLLEDEELFIDRLRQVNATGACIGIDDFGTRYTGFNMLRRLPLNSMKIDHCFVQGIDRSQEMRALSKTIVAMARQLKLHTVAEGIETPGELQVMREVGCEAGQGYLFQRPIPAEEFHQFLNEWPARKRALGFTDAPQHRYGM